MVRRSFPGPAPRTNFHQNPTQEGRHEVARPSAKRKSSPSQNSRSVRRSRLIEQLEERKVFAAPSFGGTVPTSVSLFAGAPIQIGIDGVDLDNDVLSYTVSSSNSNVTAEYRAAANRLLTFNVSYRDTSGTLIFSGKMVFQLFDDLAPEVTRRIADIAASGQYDGSIFHRIINNFVIQGGDDGGVNADGGGGIGPVFDDQFHPLLQHTGTGLLSMAKTVDDTNQSQFFITEGTSRHLDFNHSIFGMIIEDKVTSAGALNGTSLRDAISNITALDGQGRPNAGTVKIDSATITNNTQDRVLTINAPEGYTGSSTITLTVNDGHGGTATKTITVNVIPDTIDNKPFFLNLPKSLTIPANSTSTYTLPVSNLDGGSPAFFGASSFDNTKLQLVIDQSTGLMTFTPQNGFTGVVNIVFGVTSEDGDFDDGQSLYDRQTIPVYIGITPPSAPTAVNLLSTSDSGSNTTDDVTNVTNATTSAKLTFQVTGVTAGMTVRLLSNGQIIGEAVASGTTVNITTNGAYDLGPGGVASYALRSITAVQVLLNQVSYSNNVQSSVDVVSTESPILTLTVDDIAPTFTTSPSPTRFNEGTTYTYDPSTNEEGNIGHVYTLVNAPTGMTIDPTTGVVSWTPDAAQAASGGTSFTIRATDLAGNSKDQSVVLTINKKPTFTSNPVLIANEGGVYQYDASTNEDVNGGLTYSLDSAPAGMSILAGSGFISWNPNASQVTAGSHNVTLRVTDSEGAFQLQTFTIQINLKPIFTSSPVLTANEGGVYQYDASTNEDGNSGLTYSLVLHPQGMTVNASTGVVSWTPNADQAANGTADVKLRVTDADGAFQLQEFTVVINPKPDFTSSPIEKINEGAEFQYDANSDEDGASGLVYSLDTFPSGMQIDANTGVVTWTPSSGQIAAGSAPVTIRVTDAEGATSTQTFTVTINHAPTLGVITDKATNEFQELVVPGTATDIDTGDTLVYSLVNPIDGVTIDSSSGEIKFTPTELQGGTTVTITVRVRDSGNMTAETSFDVTVNETNSLPVIEPILIQRLENGESLDVEIIASDSDIPSDGPLVYEIFGIPPGLTNQPSLTQSPGSNPRLTWVPDPADGIGPFEFVIRVGDGKGFSQISVTVTQNVPPIFDPIADQSVDERTPFTITAHATDANVNDVLKYELVAGTFPVGMTIHPDTGVISWTPGESEGGESYNIQVRVYDNNNRDDITTFKLTINETNEKPVITGNPGTKNIKLGETLSIDGISATDDDNPVQTLTYLLVSGPSGASINPSTGAITWTPTEADGVGPFNFEVVVNDGIDNSDPVTFTVNVNQPPVFNPVPTQNASEGTEFSLQLTPTDPNNDPLTYTLGSGAPMGLQISATGLITWTPGESFGGTTVAFDVTVSDGVFTRTQTITIEVAETNSAPVAGSNPLVTINEGDTAEFTVNATDLDDPAQTLSYELVSGPAGATINPVTGKVTWTSTENDGSSTKPFVIRVTDSEGASVDIPMQVKVNEVNTLPVLTVGNNHTVNEGSQLSIQATATDADAPTQTLTYSLMNAPAGMTINPTTGVITWTPTEVQGPGTFEFQVKVTDSEGGSATANVKVTVNEVNSNPILAPITNRTVLQGGTVSIANSATDADLPTQSLTYSLDQAPAGVTINAVTGQISWDVPANQAVGVQEIIVRVTDSAGGFSTQSFLLEVLDFSIGNFLAIFPQGTITNVAPVDFRQFSFGQQFIVLPNFNFNPLPTQFLQSVVDNGIVNSGMGRLQGINEEIRIEEDGKQKVYKPQLPDAGVSETNSQTPAPNANTNANVSQPSSIKVDAAQKIDVKKTDASAKADVSPAKMRLLHAEALAEFTRSDLVLANLENGSSLMTAAGNGSTDNAVRTEIHQVISEDNSKSSALPTIAMAGAAVAAKSIAPRGKSAGLKPQAVPVPSMDLAQKRKSRWSWFGK